MKAFGQERGLRVYDDVKRLERDFPAQMAKIRERSGADKDDLLILAGVAGRAQEPPPRGDGVPGVRPTAPVRGAEVQRPPQAARSEESAVSCGWWISRCSNGTRKRAAGPPHTTRSLRCMTRTWRS